MRKPKPPDTDPNELQTLKALLAAESRRLEWCIRLLWSREMGLTTWLGAESEADTSLGISDPREAIDRAIEAEA